MAPQPQGPRQGEAARRAQLLERLLLTERPRLLRQVRHHSERPEDADDALADACVQFLRHYTGPSGGEDALRWMLTVSKRCAWEITRRRRERGDLAPTVPFDESGEELGSGVGDTADSVERREEVDEVLAAIERLAPDERTVLLLFGLGFSYEEIARLRGWSYAKVHRRLSDGRARVRCLLEGGDSS